jgi:hypothetical protein
MRERSAREKAQAENIIMPKRQPATSTKELYRVPIEQKSDRTALACISFPLYYHGKFSYENKQGTSRFDLTDARGKSKRRRKRHATARTLSKRRRKRHATAGTLVNRISGAEMRVLLW